MAAATADRITDAKALHHSLDKGVLAATKIFFGTIVCANAAGSAVPGADTAAFLTLGLSYGDAASGDSTCDNSAGATNDKRVKCMQGVFLLGNGDSIVEADIGKACYVQDDQTVKKAGAVNNVVAGRIEGVDTAGVWVNLVGAQP